MKTFTILTLSILVFVCCKQTRTGDTASEAKPAIDTASLIQAGQVATLQLQQVLGASLKKAVEDSGISHALKYCNLKAYPLTDSLSKALGITISRISHKPRNSANQADDKELRKIADYENKQQEGEALKYVLETADNYYTYYAPILISSPLCLKCHGQPDTDIHQEDLLVIQSLYPEDKATGFQLNDVRGLWRVEFPK